MFERSQAMKEITTKLLHFKPEVANSKHTQTLVVLQ